MSEEQQPLSLNQRHRRILHDLSATPCQLSFDLSPTEQINPSNADLIGESKVSSEESESSNDGVPQFSIIFDSDSIPEEQKPQKVKLAGRRRLCKVSSTEVTADGGNGPVVTEISDFDEISGFDSPYGVNKCTNGAADEIRDILSDLSSRLDALSIKKVRNVSREAMADQPRSLFSDTVSTQQNKEDNLEFQTLSEEDNLVFDDSDCSVFTSHEFVQKTDKESKQFFKEREDLINVDSCDWNETDDSSSEVECPFTLDGPKDTYRLPNNIATMLFPHQRDGLKWLWSLHCCGKGGILGDDMGLGKTMQICGFLAGLFHSRLVRRALVVAPKTLLSHWLKELSAAGISEITREYCGTSAKIREYELQYILQDKGILLTTYDIVRNNSRSLQGKSYCDDADGEDNITWDYMILDEGHLIKNPTTQRAQSLLEIPSAHRIIISGTPIQNNLKELWALFHFCCPGLLGDKKWFKDKYEYPILRGQDKRASERDKRIGSAVAKELRDRIQPYFLRRLKREVFHENNDTASSNLSKKNEIIIWLKLTACQRQLYEAFLRSELALSSFHGSPLAAITILKKICDHPLLLTKRAAEDVLEGIESMPSHEDQKMAEEVAMKLADVTGSMNIDDKHYISCKMTFILTLLDILIPEGHSVLIFSQTRKMLNLIQESLVSEGYRFLRIDGTTKSSDRVKIVDEFQEGTGAPIFLLTSQVGGLGLTLTNADRVIVVDPAWNPSTDNQSVDRAYRIGQKKDVVVYRLMTCGTVEEKIYRKQIFKGGLFKSATEHMEHIRYFSQQDLMELFSLPKEGFDVSLTQRQLHEEHDCLHTVDTVLGNHIKFLETRGIAGVSHHSLLFSRAAPIQDAQEEIKEAVPVGRAPFLTHSHEHCSDGSENAMNPKDVKLHAKIPISVSPTMSLESEIRTRINRLSLLLENEEMVSKLPDGGKKIKLQIAELKSELENVRSKETSRKVIDVDEVATELQQKLNVHTASQ